MWHFRLAHRVLLYYSRYFFPVRFICNFFLFRKEKKLRWFRKDFFRFIESLWVFVMKRMKMDGAYAHIYICIEWEVKVNLLFCHRPSMHLEVLDAWNMEYPILLMYIYLFHTGNREHCIAMHFCCRSLATERCIQCNLCFLLEPVFIQSGIPGAEITIKQFNEWIYITRIYYCSLSWLLNCHIIIASAYESCAFDWCDNDHSSCNRHYDSLLYYILYASNANSQFVRDSETKIAYEYAKMRKSNGDENQINIKIWARMRSDDNYVDIAIDSMTESFITTHYIVTVDMQQDWVTSNDTLQSDLCSWPAETILVA